MALSELEWRTLTAVVNNMKTPAGVLKNKLFGNARAVETEKVELHTVENGREIAPFVKINDSATMVEGYTSTTRTVTPPNIRIKRPFTPSDLLFTRRPGSVIYQNGGSQNSALRQHIARDLRVLDDLRNNTEEYLSSGVLQGSLSYTSGNAQDAFDITIPRPAGNSITLTTFWNDGTPADVDVNKDIHTVKRVMSDAAQAGLSITDAFCGSEVVDTLHALVRGGHLPQLDNRRIEGNALNQGNQFDEQGLIYLGRIAGINFWEYSRTISVNGVSTPLIRAKWVEFVNMNSSQSGRVTLYGAIPDHKAMGDRVFAGRSFSKSWEEEDPSIRWFLLASRPLPHVERVDSWVSMKVISG